MVAIVAGRTLLSQLAVTGVLTAVAAYAGLQVATVDGGQAGLAVLWVHVAAFPLAVAIWVGAPSSPDASNRHRRDRPGPRTDWRR